MSAWIQTYSGRQFFPLAPKATDVDLRDIAHALAQQCRYTGHTLRFYSVAEHSVRVSRRVGELTGNDPDACLWGLLHDASEAYLVDVPSPLKRLPEFAFYREAEKRLTAVVAERFGLTSEEPAAVRQADLELLSTERLQLLGPPPAPWGALPEPISTGRLGWGTSEAVERFLLRFGYCETLRRSARARGAA